MNTSIGITVGQEGEKHGDTFRSLLLLLRNFLSQASPVIQRSYARDSYRYMPNVPPRVWRRHSALLSLRVQHLGDSIGLHNSGTN